jgi:hypothetical protein
MFGAELNIWYSSYRCLPADVCPSCLASVICGVGKAALSKRFVVRRQGSRSYIGCILLNNIIYCQPESHCEGRTLTDGGCSLMVQ